MGESCALFIFAFSGCSAVPAYGLCFFAHPESTLFLPLAAVAAATICTGLLQLEETLSLSWGCHSC